MLLILGSYETVIPESCLKSSKSPFEPYHMLMKVTLFAKLPLHLQASLQTQGTLSSHAARCS